MESILSTPYFCQGEIQLKPELQKLVIFYKDKESPENNHSISLPTTDCQQLETIVDNSYPATFGLNAESVYDPSYRAARTLYTEQFATTLGKKINFTRLSQKC